MIYNGLNHTHFCVKLIFLVTLYNIRKIEIAT